MIHLPFQAVNHSSTSHRSPESKFQSDALADLRNVVSRQLRRLPRQVRLLAGIRLDLGDWRRHVRLWKDRNIRLRRIRVGDVRHGGLSLYCVPGGGTKGISSGEGSP
jgi:hypothetical protein